MLRAYLDPDTGRSEPKRLRALAYYLGHDLPDFDGLLKKLRALAGPLFPCIVKTAAGQDELRAVLPGACALITESLAVGETELNAAPQLKVPR